MTCAKLNYEAPKRKKKNRHKYHKSNFHTTNKNHFAEALLKRQSTAAYITLKTNQTTEALPKRQSSDKFIT